MMRAGLGRRGRVRPVRRGDRPWLYCWALVFERDWRRGNPRRWGFRFKDNQRWTRSLRRFRRVEEITPNQLYAMAEGIGRIEAVTFISYG